MNYSTSFVPTSGTDQFGRLFKPTTGEGGEVGVKFRPLGSNLLLTAAIFETTQQNVLTADPTNVIFSVQTGEVRVRGIELEARGNITRELEVIGAFSKLDPKVTKSNDGFVGNYLVNTSLDQAALWTKYTWYDGPVAGLGHRRWRSLRRPELRRRGQYDPDFPPTPCSTPSSVLTSNICGLT